MISTSGAAASVAVDSDATTSTAGGGWPAEGGAGKIGRNVRCVSTCDERRERRSGRFWPAGAFEIFLERGGGVGGGVSRVGWVGGGGWRGR